MLDGKDLESYNLGDLRQNIGIIFQDYIRFQMKASENIAIGNIENRIELDIIKDAAKKSLADTVIDNLPDEYNQVLGRRDNRLRKSALAAALSRDLRVFFIRALIKVLNGCVASSWVPTLAGHNPD